MKYLKLFLAGIVLSVVAACGTSISGVTVGPNTQIAAAESAVTQARSQADNLYLAHKITKVDGQNLQNQCDTITALLEALRGLPTSTDTTTKINQALALLTALQGYLTTKAAS